MAIFRSSAIGGVISGLDSNSISNELDINDPSFGALNVGTTIWNIGVGAAFVLAASSTALVTDQILAVKNFDGLRWIKVVAATADAPTNAATFTAALNVATNSLKGLLSANDYAGQFKNGAALTDSNATIVPGTANVSKYILPGPLTNNRVLTLDNTNGVNTMLLQIVVLDTSAFTYTINNDQGIGFGFVHPANGVPTVYQWYFDGTRWTKNTSWYTN